MQARGVLQHSKIFDAGKTETLCLQDYLSIGPILDLETKKGRNDRIEWLSEICQDFMPDEIARIVKSDGELLDCLKHKIDHYDQICLWAGSDVSETLAASRLLYFLRMKDCSRFFAIDFLNASVTRRIGTFIYPKSLNETNLDQVAELYTNFNVIEKAEVSRMQSLWEKLRNDESNLRIPTSKSQISASEIDFYDANIMVHCTKRYQRAIRIVGETLGNMNEKSMREGVPDSFLSWRLNKLIEQGKLKYRGCTSSIRGYEVKLA